MSNLDALLSKDLVHNSGSQPCLIGRTIISLSDPHKSALVALIEGDESADEVASRMRAAGLRSSGTTIRRHRKGHCLCPIER